MSAVAGLQILGNALINPSAAGPRQVTLDDLVPVLEDIAYRFSIVSDVLQDADNQATSSILAATEAADQAEVIGQDVKDITEHTYTVVIPHSMSWLAGYIVSHFITPLEERVGKLESSVAFLMGWRGQIDSWRRNFVDPNVEKWVGFREWFDAWPQGILFRWKDYFDNPVHFADWATAPLVGPIVAYIADPAHKQTRDNLTLILSGALRDDSQRVYNDVLSWLLSDT